MFSSLIAVWTEYIHSKLKLFCFPVCRVKGVMADQEESLLQQLTEITQMMQEGQLVEGMAPEKKPQDDWKGKRFYPQENVYIRF